MPSKANAIATKAAVQDQLRGLRCDLAIGIAKASPASYTVRRAAADRSLSQSQRCSDQVAAGWTAALSKAGLPTARDHLTIIEQITQLLHEAGETHHRVYRVVDGADDDWASWYADWLVKLTELPTLLSTNPVRSELTYLLVSLDKEYASGQPDEPWESYYAQRILAHFSLSGR